MHDNIMKIYEAINAAVAAEDIDALDALENDLFVEGGQSPAPFAPALQLTPDAERRFGDATPGMAPLATNSGFSQWVINVANTLSQAKRRVRFKRKISGGFQGHVIVSVGDSWFQYPHLLEDVIDHLSADEDKAILSFGAAGDVLSNIADRQEYLDPIAQTDAALFLISASGNDLLGAGALARVLLPYQTGMQQHELLDEHAIGTVLAQIERDYRRILETVFAQHPDINILGHVYDVPVPRENGGWIGKPLKDKGIPFDVGRDVVGLILDRFADLLRQFELEYDGYHVVETRGAVGDSVNSWHDEIHPKDTGYGRVAEKFREKISAQASPITVASVPEFLSFPLETAPLSATTMSQADDVIAPDSISARPLASTRDNRTTMARRILDFEARRHPQTGHLMVYDLHPEDGGGRYEVAGINERYHKEEADHLVAMIEAGLHDDAERYATDFIANYTDPAAWWCSSTAVQSYLRDCMFNRGPGGAAWIVQDAVGVARDRVVGDITRRAIATAEADPSALLDRLRASRETYERLRRDESSRFWRGLVNRWNKALDFAKTFLIADEIDAALMPLRGAHAGVGAEPFSPILNCNESKEVENDWPVTAAFHADILRSSPIPEAHDLRRDWWRIGNQFQTGSCVGWAAADSVLRWHFVKTGRLLPNMPLSVRFLWVAAKETDVFNSFPTTFLESAGTSLKAALDIARKLGNVTSDVLPFDQDPVFSGDEIAFYARAAQLKIRSYHNLGRNLDDWRRWIYQSGPILTRLEVDAAFMVAKRDTSHLSTYTAASGYGGHAVALVGYTRDGFIVRNSWGETWADRGFALASNAYAQNAFTEAYGVTA